VVLASAVVAGSGGVPLGRVPASARTPAVAEVVAAAPVAPVALPGLLPPVVGPGVDPPAGPTITRPGDRVALR
jgi:hypothetical protein